MTDISLKAITLESNMVVNDISFNKAHSIQLEGFRANGKKVTMTFTVEHTRQGYAMIKNIKNNDLYDLYTLGNEITYLYTKNNRRSLENVNIIMVY